MKIFAPTSKDIVVLAMHKIGDSVFTVPAIRFLRQRYPESKITVFCYPNNVRVYEYAFGEDVEIVELDPKLFSRGERWAPAEYRKHVQSLKPGKVFDLLGSLKSFSLIFTLPVKHISAITDPMLAGFFDERIYQQDYNTLIDPYLVTVGADPEKDKNLKYFPVRENRNNSVLINPFGGWKAKEWNFVKFIELYKKLQTDYDVTFVFQKGLIKDDILKQLDVEEIKYVESASMDHLFEITDNCGAFISNDTGPLYVANLLGSPTFAIYGPTNPDYTKPLGEEHEYIQKILKCSSKPIEKFCYTYGGRIGCPAFECMNLLSVEIVYNNIIKFLKRNNIAPRNS
ncbi:MAG: hypothetical protein SCALA702_05070 [Melioribacteraceae bacterium]|nr:MAG: hypothetical protein SCALA702_05070 [Melioribacteraceae bacterium]